MKTLELPDTNCPPYRIQGRMHILPSPFSVRRVANSEIQRFLKLLDGQRGDVLRSNKSNDAKTSGVRISSSRQRSTASARTASAFFSSSVSKRSPFIALILRGAPNPRTECLDNAFSRPHKANPPARCSFVVSFHRLRATDIGTTLASVSGAMANHVLACCGVANSL